MQNWHDIWSWNIVFPESISTLFAFLSLLANILILLNPSPSLQLKVSVEVLIKLTIGWWCWCCSTVWTFIILTLWILEFFFWTATTATPFPLCRALYSPHTKSSCHLYWDASFRFAFTMRLMIHIFDNNYTGFCRVDGWSKIRDAWWVQSFTCINAFISSAVYSFT